MCEVVVRVADKAAPHHPLRRHKTSRGDVITAQVDGWNWGRLELSNTEWRIVRLPGVAKEELADVMATVRHGQGFLLDRRKRGIDLESIPQVEAKLRSGEVTTLLPADVRAFLTARKDRATLNHLVTG